MGGNATGVTVNVTGLPSGATTGLSPAPPYSINQNQTQNVVLTVNSAASTPAATSTITATASATGANSGSDTASLTIGKKSVTGTVVAGNKIYDGTTTATITSCTIPGKVGTD